MCKDATPNPAVACRAPSLRSARNKEMIMTAKKDPQKGYVALLGWSLYAALGF